MKGVQEQSKEQARWNQIGTSQLRDIEENPNGHFIGESSISQMVAYDELMLLMSPLQDKEILELGCGRGELSVVLSKQGAKVTGVDIGPELIAASEALAKVNQVSCSFQQCNITSLPYESDTYDIIIGIAILHHLSQSDVLLALSESWRVLRSGGVAIFYEPVENSKAFDFIQSLFPAGTKGSKHYRPSILQRNSWKYYIRSLDDRTMTNQELIEGGKGYFRNIHLIPFGFTIRLQRLIGYRYRHFLLALDRFIFRVFPPLSYFSQTVLVVYRK